MPGVAVQTGNTVDLKKIEENVAMHLFTMVEVEKLVEEKFETPDLGRAFHLCRQEVALPSREKLMTELLDRCFDKVKTRVDGFFKSGVVPVTLSLNVSAGSDKEVVVDYMATLASSEKYPMFLESVKYPRNGDVDTIAEFAARDAARVVEKLTCPVAGCVMPCSSPETRQAREQLEKQFPAMYFHGCLRAALLSLVRQLFVPNHGASDTERKSSILVPFSQDLQQFALQCQDLVFFLPRIETPSYLDNIVKSSKSMMHVTVRRRLTVEEAFAAILQSEPYLDADSVLNQLFSTSSDGKSTGRSAHTHHPVGLGHLQTQLVKIVRSPQFGEKLRKYLEVLRPVHALLSSLDDGTSPAPLALSEVYYSFSKLAQQFTSSPLLQPDEKAALQALIRRQQESVLGPAHLLAHLLDPVMLGENFKPDTKSDVEEKLLSSYRADGCALSDSEKEVLYAQYTDFKKSALHQKTNKADTLMFRTLKERKKSPLQFWFTDGAKWPVLQAIACRIFVMPVCAAWPVCAARETYILLREKVNLLASNKLTFVRVNARQLNLADADGSSLAAMVQAIQPESSANDITASMVV
ncbi:unnamed protein product [Phytophthora lilii]|uniref:Unnamed protein product n=1 Tax=Phytophthora lilii TaxID=2077276 RepID=A0A9W6WV46_9STRA|nr:unnamed protein product [Phytophthora lilii]